MDNSAGYGIDTVSPELNSDTEAKVQPISQENTEDVGQSDGASGSAPEAEAGTADMTDGYAAESSLSDAEDTDSTPASEVDYERIMREDLEVLRANFPELSELRDISELSGAMRYAALRDLGLTAIEAYLATSHRAKKRDGRAHLSSAVSQTAGAPRGAMSRAELSVAREILSGLSDSQIYNLYKRVTN